MTEPRELLNSITSKPMPKWLSAVAVVFGLAQFYGAFRSYMDNGLNVNILYLMIIGLVCTYGAGVSRKLYLADIGVVREARAWKRVIRRTLPWDSVKYVHIAFRGQKMMVFFEVDFTGWKVMFSRDQRDAVINILNEYLPEDVEIDLGEK